MGKSVSTLVERLKEIGIDVSEENFIRTRAGKNMLFGGAFSWCFMRNDSFSKIVGGCSPVKDYINKNILLSILETRCGDIEVFAEDGQTTK